MREVEHGVEKTIGDHRRLFAGRDGKDTAGARMAEDLRPQLPIRVGSRMPSDWTGGNTGIRPKLKFARQQIPQAVVVHDQIRSTAWAPS